MGSASSQAGGGSALQSKGVAVQIATLAFIALFRLAFNGLYFRPSLDDHQLFRRVDSFVVLRRELFPAVVLQRVGPEEFKHLSSTVHWLVDGGD